MRDSERVQLRSLPEFSDPIRLLISQQMLIDFLLMAISSCLCSVQNVRYCQWKWSTCSAGEVLREYMRLMTELNRAVTLMLTCK